MIGTVLKVAMMATMISSQTVFTSNEMMGNLLKLEKQLVAEMKRHSEDLEMALNSIEEYVSQVSEVFRIRLRLYVMLTSTGIQFKLSEWGVYR